jgi:hypothetical protein
MATLCPTTTADGKPVIPMTDEQKYWFDIKGWHVLPALFNEDELKPIRAHQMRFLYERDTLPAHERDNHGGASEVLLDHPAVVGVLNEIISHQPITSEECYGFRYDHTYSSHRKAGHVAPEVIAAMKPIRQTLFRAVWTAFGDGERSNKHYSEANRAV